MADNIEILDDGRTVGYRVRDLLREAIKDMDVPSLRRDTEKDSNVRWLARNLGINNAEHEYFRVAMSFIRALLR